VFASVHYIQVPINHLKHKNTTALYEFYSFRTVNTYILNNKHQFVKTVYVRIFRNTSVGSVDEHNGAFQL
jgi:hypothetical protein